MITYTLTARHGRVQCLQSGNTDQLNGYSENFEKLVLEQSRRLLPRTMGPCTVRSVPNSTIAVGEDGFALFVSLERVTKMLRAPEDADSLAQLYSTIGTPDLDRRRAEQKSNYPPTDSNDLKLTEYAIDLVAGHRGTIFKTNYEVRCYEDSAEEDTNESASALLTEFSDATWRPDINTTHEGPSRRESGVCSDETRRRIIYSRLLFLPGRGSHTLPPIYSRFPFQ